MSLLHGASAVPFSQISIHTDPRACLCAADTKNAVHDEMAAGGSSDDYLHIVVGSIDTHSMPFLASYCQPFARVQHFALVFRNIIAKAH